MATKSNRHRQDVADLKLLLGVKHTEALRIIRTLTPAEVKEINAARARLDSDDVPAEQRSDG